MTGHNIVIGPKPPTMLKARLYELELNNVKKNLMPTSASKTDILLGSSNPILTVLQPYQMVKDNRSTGLKRQCPWQFADGDIDVFLEAALAHRV